MFDETLDDMIEGGLTEEVATYTLPNYYKELFPIGFFPGTKVKLRNYITKIDDIEIVIIDHTKIKCGGIRSEEIKYRNANGDDIEKIRRDKSDWKDYVFIMVPESLHNDSYFTYCYFFPFYMINIGHLERIDQ